MIRESAPDGIFDNDRFARWVYQVFLPADRAILSAFRIRDRLLSITSWHERKLYSGIGSPYPLEAAWRDARLTAAN